MDWTDYLARQALCNFPQLLDGSPAQRALGWASIALPVPLAGAAGSPPPRLAAGLVEAAWAITLQCFVGEDFVCFGLVPQQPTLAVRPIKLHLDPSETAAELVEEVLDAKARTAGLGPIALPDLAFVAGSSFNTISALSPLVGHELAAACASSSVSLAISVHQVDSTFTCELWHRTTGLSQVHAANVASTYVHILLELVRDETQSLGTINLVGERDSQQIRAWNSQMPSTVHSCMHDLVSQQVSKTPSRTAICSWDGELSYAKLEQRSERLAVHLRQNGVKAEVVVPCCFEKSLWAVIAQLAILKAGGACTFVDVSHPARRVNQIVEQTYARLVLASPNTKHVFESLNVEILCVDSQNFDNLPALTAPWDGSLDAGPTSNAFVVYTSGSTGIPKGIVLEHAALCTSIRDHGEAMGFQPESRVLQFAAYSFDVSIADQFTTLIHGGCVCIPSEADRMGNLAEAINSLGVNQLYLTPTVASILSPHEVPGVKRLSLGGEAVKQSVIALWADKVDLINIYGPAEASIWCAYLRGLRNDTDPRDLGYAIGCQCHVIDPRNCDRLVPVGAVGEIVIQGPILARSYLDEPEKTRQAFLEHPRWPSYDAKLNPPSTIYRTGDLARYTFDGNLRFSGRKDTQAKLRGQRIEIEEVQHHLKACLAGRHEIAVDILAPAGEEQPVLIGYIVVSNEEGDAHAKGAFLAAPTQQVRESLKALTTGLRARLAQRVPRYMIPSIYIPLTCLPRSTSGKLDRKTLNLTMARLTMADLSAYEVSADGKGEALTPTESKLAALLASAVGVPKDILDQRTTLYDLGGDSMHAMKFAAMARHSGYAVSVKSLLAGASLRDLALGPTTENEEEVDGEFPPFSLLNSNNATQSVLDEASEQSRVPVDSIEDIYPCSPLQEGIFALSLKQPGSYVGRHSVMLPQDVNLAEYQTAWRLVAEENAIFRTRILHSETHGAFLQMVVKEDLRWSVGDPSQSNQLPPMLPGAPLVYLDIAVRGNPHCVVLHAHHALYDGWSLFKTFERVRDVYMGLSQGPSVPFARFIRHLQQLDPEASQHYWLAQMKGAPQCTFPALPHDGYSVAANANVSQHIADFTPPLRFTSATILRAAWALVLSKYEGSSDIIFGETLSGRSAMRTAQDMLGPTMTTVPLRVRIDEVSSLHEFLLAVQTTYADMLPFEHTGLGEIRRSCRKAGETCDFRSLLVIQPKTAQSAKVPTLLLSGVADIVAKSYPLMLELMLGEDSCDVRASFDSQIIDSRQAQRVLHQFSHVIRQLCRNEGDKYVQEIEVCSPEDVVELAIWNAPVPETHRTCVHTELRAQMLRSPDAEAISSWDGTFTYAQLAHYTSKLASHLRSIGVGPEVLVPLCFDKSGLAVLTGVAVLEAGGACVYVDPMYPRAKLENVLKKVNARHVVCGANYEALFQGASQTLVPLSFETLAALPTASDTQAPSSVCPENAAFVVFTSGSMGEPKGIVQDHTSYCSTMKLHGPILGSGPGRRVFQFSANTFDAFLSDVITTLANGGCVCIPSEYERINDLAATMRRMKVNQAMFTPTVVQLLEPEDIPLVKTMTLGGEPLLQNILLKWSEHLRIINLYGPSEVAIWCTYKDGLTSTSDPRNIGRGVGVSTWITDAENPERLAPIGGIGEILVAGPALARGYISDEKRTKASFISAPKWFNSLPNTMQWHRRLYRTGDLGRFNSDGSISIIGRRDSQVKLHGRRIELDEIENALRMCLNGTPVRRVAAEMIAPQRGSGETVLVAFMSFGEERLDERSLDEMASRATVGLQQAMCRVVAQHMVPSAFVGVDEIPSTLHGKTDRFKLRELGRSLSAQRLARSAQKDSSNGLRRPLTGKEVDLQRLWARILKVNPAGISLDDSFIALGGDSVSAMRLVSLARAEGISLSVANIFQSTTLQELATSLEDPASAQASACHSTDPTRLKLLPAGIEIEPILTTVAKMCDVLPDLIEDVYPCTAMQEGLMALSDQKAGAYVSQEVFDLQTAIDLPRLRSAFNEVVETFPILRTRIVWLDSVGFTQVVVRQRIPWYESNDLIHGLDNAKKSGLSQGEALTSFTVVNDPVQPSPILIWTIHHALYDGQSQRQLYEAVHKAYNGLRIPLPPNYNNYVRYITDKDRSESCSRFWSDHTRGFAFVKWPVAEQGPSLLRQDSAHIFMPIKRKPSSITMSTMLKAAWSIVVSKYTNSSQVAFGLTVAGRNAPIPSIEQMPGPTLATLPCCMEVSSSCSVGAYLSRVQRHSTDLIPFEHFGLQNIARLSPQAKDVCAFQNILVIQPPSSTSESTILDDIGRMSKGLDDFNDYPLMIFCVPGATGGVKVTANYQTSSVSQQQVDRVLNHFKTVLQQLLECEPGTTKVGAINMFSPEDRTELFRWNKHVPDRHYACLHDMIFSWSRWQPYDMAVCSWDGDMTYADLDQVSTALAVQLRALSVAHGQIVPLCFEKSRWTIVSMLAVHKCGAAFVPLDPVHPKSRHQEIIDDVEAQLLLCSPFINAYCIELGMPLLVVSSETVQPRTPCPQFEPVALQGNDVSHILFTSGTTGKPKGVVIEHQHMASSIAHHAPAMGFTRGTRVLQFSSYTFDVSIAEIMTTLVRGGCVCVPSEDDRTNNLTGVMNDMKVELAVLTPSVVRTLKPESLPSLKTLILGGEVVGGDIVERWADALNLINGYGPCECAVFSTIDYIANDGMHLDTIGSPVGCIAWIVDPDDHSTLVPIGCPGELVIQGPIVTRGYVNNLSRSQEPFFENPPWALTSQDQTIQRYYKTGDLVQFLPNGSLRLLGRQDTQVKVRGQRLELSEIEQKLTVDPNVEHAVVVFAKSGHLSERLAAVLTLRFGSDNTKTNSNPLCDFTADPTSANRLRAVRSLLEQKLPSFMLPSAFSIVNRFPFLQSGKLDRRRVQEWVENLTVEAAHTAMDLEATGVRTAPETRVERTMEAIWANVLNVDCEKIGTSRSFLSVGGDSITAMQVVAKARAQGLRTSVRDVLKSGSVQELAVLVKTAESDPIAGPDRLNESFELAPIQQWYFDLEPEAFGAAHFNQSFTLQINSPVKAAKVERAIRELVKSPLHASS